MYSKAAHVSSAEGVSQPSSRFDGDLFGKPVPQRTHQQPQLVSCRTDFTGLKISPSIADTVLRQPVLIGGQRQAVENRFDAAQVFMRVVSCIAIEQVFQTPRYGVVSIQKSGVQSCVNVAHGFLVFLKVVRMIHAAYDGDRVQSATLQLANGRGRPP